MTKWVVMAALALAGCKAGSEASKPVAGPVMDQGEARQVFETTIKSWASGDSAEVMRHYADGAVLIDAGRGRPSTDRNEQTQWTAQFMTMHPSDFVNSDVNIQPLGPDAFVASGISAFTADVGAGRTVLHVRFSQVYRRQDDGQWKIVHEHVSAPPPEGQQ